MLKQINSHRPSGNYTPSSGTRLSSAKQSNSKRNKKYTASDSKENQGIGDHLIGDEMSPQKITRTSALFDPSEIETNTNQTQATPDQVSVTVSPKKHIGAFNAQVKNLVQQRKPVMSEIRPMPMQNSNSKAEKVHTPTRAAELNESQYTSVSYTTEQFKAIIGDNQVDNVVIADKENPMSMALRHMGNSNKLASKYSSTGRPSSSDPHPKWNMSTNKNSPQKSFNSASRRSPNF
jgi:hypothetical protein